MKMNEREREISLYLRSLGIKSKLFSFQNYITQEKRQVFIKDPSLLNQLREDENLSDTIVEMSEKCLDKKFHHLVEPIHEKIVEFTKTDTSYVELINGRNVFPHTQKWHRENGRVHIGKPTGYWYTYNVPERDLSKLISILYRSY